MATLSVVMIVKNEAPILAACLERLAWVDEIVVLDGGSSDGTVEVARRYTDKVFIAADWQGYGVQRQRAQGYATGDWVLMVDADEHVSPELKQNILAVLQRDDRNTAYALPILPWCFGRFLRHGGWYPAHKVRLYARDKAHYGEQRVHEKLDFAPGVHIEKLKGDLLHYTYRDLEHYLVKSAKYASEFAQQRAARGKRASLLEGALHGVGCFVRMYFVKAGFLDGRQGLLMALLSAHSTFVKYVDLWSRSQPKSSSQ
jgi:(heptosyl)LPS beta-1,4-glucosyltransferase